MNGIHCHSLQMLAMSPDAAKPKCRLISNVRMRTVFHFVWRTSMYMSVCTYACMSIGLYRNWHVNIKFHWLPRRLVTAAEICVVNLVFSASLIKMPKKLPLMANDDNKPAWRWMWHEFAYARPRQLFYFYCWLRLSQANCLAILAKLKC